MQLAKITRFLGILGTLLCVFLFVKAPSWPTPDKLLVFITLLAASFGQGWSLFKKLAPFVLLLLTYESFRGLVPKLNQHVDFTLLPKLDRAMFGGTLPTTWLQSHLWHGSIRWFDFVLYLVYMLHFVLPLALAVLIWKKKVKFYWQYAVTYISCSFAAFVMFLLFPAAPPWMASRDGIIEPITRVSSNVWGALGIHDFPSVYNKISPNPVAAMPSLHAAYSTIFALYIFKLYGKRWGALAALYPILIYFGTVYQGEHYLIDEIVGALFGAVAFKYSPQVLAALLRFKDSLLAKSSVAINAIFRRQSGEENE